MELALDQQPRKSNQPYQAVANVEALLQRAAVGARFEDSVAVEGGKLQHRWPSRRLALAGCKLQASVKLSLGTDASGRVGFPETPQDQWPRELGKLLRSAKLGILASDKDDEAESVTLVEGQGVDWPHEALQYHASVGCPDVTYSVVWELPISAPIPLYTALALECDVAPFAQWTVLDVTLLPRYEVIEPIDEATTRLERVLVHRQPSDSGAVRVPLPAQRLLHLEFEERNGADALTPFRDATLWTQSECGEVLLSLSDRAIADGKVELHGLDCRGCELMIAFDSNDHLKLNDRAAAMAAFGLGTPREAPSARKTFTLRMVAAQDLYTSPALNAWQ